MSTSRIGIVMAAIGGTALLGAVNIVTAQMRFSETDVATIFFVSKSDDRNRVDYGIRLDASCHPVGRSPVVVYWREFENGRDGRVTHGLNLLEGPVYGVGSQRVTERRPDGATLEVTVRAISSRRIRITTSRNAEGTCTAEAVLAINGTTARLHHVHLTLGDGPGSLRHAEIFGSTAAGERVVERVPR